MIIVIVSETASMDIIHTSPSILHVCIGLQHVLDFIIISVGDVDHGKDFFATYPVTEVGTALDLTAQIVTAIDMVTKVGETALTHVGLRVSEDVGITGASKGIEEATVVEIHTGITDNQSVVTATVDELHVGHLIRSVISARLTFTWSLEVDGGAVLLVEFGIIIFTSLV